MDTDRPEVHLFSCFDADGGADVCATPHRVPTRGVKWVLRWACAVAVLFVSSSVLLEFAYCLAAEHTLARAARAGALEATLPRATTNSIRETVARRLAYYSHAAGSMRLVIHRNHQPTTGRWHARPGDRISVCVTLPSAAVLPRWLARIKFWRGNSPIEASAERIMPGRMISGEA